MAARPMCLSNHKEGISVRAEGKRMRRNHTVDDIVGRGTVFQEGAVNRAVTQSTCARTP